MTAKEMFEALGYKKSIYDDPFPHIEWYASGLGTIEFNLSTKTFCTYERMEALDIDMQTFKAIKKQLEELRWI